MQRQGFYIFRLPAGNLDSHCLSFLVIAMNDTIAVLKILVRMKFWRHHKSIIGYDIDALNSIKGIAANCVVRNAMSNHIPSLLEHFHEIWLYTESVLTPTPEPLIRHVHRMVFLHSLDDGRKPDLSRRNPLKLDSSSQG